MIDWLPVPRPYRDGMRIQFGFENDVSTGFLFGRLYHGSLWYYLPGRAAGEDTARHDRALARRASA